jgi:hypothetical protein
MAKLICPDCGESVRDFFSHVCPRAKKSGGGGESRPADGRTAKAALLGTAVKSHPDLSGASTCQSSQAGPDQNRDAVGVATDPPDTFLQPRKRGKPRIGDPPRDKPWEKLGMSERTWQRRRAEAKKKDER